MSLILLALRARQAFELEIARDQVLFVEALAREIRRNPAFRAPQVITPTTVPVKTVQGIELDLRDVPRIDIAATGALDCEVALAEILRDGSRLNLPALAARMAALLPSDDFDAERACGLAQGKNLWGGRSTGEYEKYCRQCGELVRTAVRRGNTRTTVVCTQRHRVDFDVTQQFAS